MRQDQYEKLQQLEEQLYDAFIGEADPSKWPGQGIDAGSMCPQTRGDRYWVKKNAAATGALAVRVGNMIGRVQTEGGTTQPAEPDDEEAGERQLDAEIADAEKEAARLMRDLQKGSKAKAAFDRKVHGKP